MCGLGHREAKGIGVEQLNVMSVVGDRAAHHQQAKRQVEPYANAIAQVPHWRVDQ
jgi:hypothetical protein